MIFAKWLAFIGRFGFVAFTNSIVFAKSCAFFEADSWTDFDTITMDFFAKFAILVSKLFKCSQI